MAQNCERIETCCIMRPCGLFEIGVHAILAWEPHDQTNRPTLCEMQRPLPAFASLLLPSGVLPSQLPPWLLITTHHTKFDACASAILCALNTVHGIEKLHSRTRQMLSRDSLPGVHPFLLPCPEPSPAWHVQGRSGFKKRNWRDSGSRSGSDIALSLAVSLS